MNKEDSPIEFLGPITPEDRAAERAAEERRQKVKESREASVEAPKEEEAPPKPQYTVRSLDDNRSMEEIEQEYQHKARNSHQDSKKMSIKPGRQRKSSLRIK